MYKATKSLQNRTKGQNKQKVLGKHSIYYF